MLVMMLPLYGSFPLTSLRGMDIDPLLLLLRVLLLLVLPWVQPTYFQSSVSFSLPFLCISINYPKELDSVSASQSHAGVLRLLSVRGQA